MITPAIRHVDAFTKVPLEGNPCAVVDGEGLAGETMQRIALNQKLSETVFLLPPESDENHARLRIFTPGSELPFAGHPTLSAAHILISEGRVSLKPGESLRLETGAGLIPLEVSFGSRPDEPTSYTMTQRPPVFSPARPTRAQIASWIGLAPSDILLTEVVNTGIAWLLAQVGSLEAVERARCDVAAIGDQFVSFFCIGAAAPEASIRVRTFAPSVGVPEDPVTGSSNGCIAALIAKHGLLRVQQGRLNYVAEQGIECGQPGRVYLRVRGIPDAISVQVGGFAVTVLRGELRLPGA